MLFGGSGAKPAEGGGGGDKKEGFNMGNMMEGLKKANEIGQKTKDLQKVSLSVIIASRDFRDTSFVHRYDIDHTCSCGCVCCVDCLLFFCLRACMHAYRTFRICICPGGEGGEGRLVSSVTVSTFVWKFTPTKSRKMKVYSPEFFFLATPLPYSSPRNPAIFFS